MSDDEIKAMKFADAMKNLRFMDNKEVNEVRMGMTNKDTLITELVGALENCRAHLNKQWKSEADPSSGFAMLTDNEMALSEKMDATLAKAKDQTNDR